TRPQLYTNHISNNMVIVNSPEVYQYVIADYSGRMIRKGTVTQGASSINISNITNGAYIIQFTNNGNTYVEKFVKQ
ncbi:MAG TPA: T9SS type A sorting domain-containing protein, partial [Chitinophagaceae bacterium]